MKIFFEGTKDNNSPKDSAWTSAWSQVVADLGKHSSKHEVVYDKRKADYIIQSSSGQITWKAVFSTITQGRNCFVWDWGDRPTGIAKGFYTSLPGSLFESQRHRQFCYPIDYNDTITRFPQSDAIYDFGLMGGITATVRMLIFEKFGPNQIQNNTFFKTQSADWSRYFCSEEDFLKTDYAEFLRKTRFILCPRGYGLGTIRLFETMKAERVPVILSDRYVLPTGPDWDRCSIRIAENQYESIPEIVSRRNPEWSELATNARTAWEQNFSPRIILDRIVEEMQQMESDLNQRTVLDRITFRCMLAREVLEHYCRPFFGKLRRRLLHK